MSADRLVGWKAWGEARGFTLVEMLTVMAIIVMLSVMSIVATGPFLARNRIRYAARQAHAAILQARHFAIATNSTASLVVYYGERFAVVTNSMFEPIDAPVVLPEGISFRPAKTHLPTTSSHPTIAQWTAILGDGKAATAAGYKTGCRPVMVVTFQNDGTVRYVTPNATSARSDGTIVLSIGGSAVGTLQGGCGEDDNEIQISSSASFETRGMVVVDNEVVCYQSLVYSAAENRTVLKNVTRGVYTSRRTHASGGEVFSASNSAILVIFPLTGGVVQVI